MNIKYNKALWLIIILAIVMMIPFLGLTDFNTKGEPREAVVAYTMLKHGNWILPINNGGDIDRKSTRLNSSHYQQSRMPSSA